MRILALIAFLLSVATTAMAAPIGATVVHQQGDVSLITSAQGEGKRLPLRMGDRVTEGDRIRTGRNGSVEIEFDTGSVIKVDENTDLVVRSLRRDDKGSTFSIFGLLFGRVKSAVKKLTGSDSRFEYHTKAVVAGVAGTPPWVINVPHDNDKVAEVDLLGAKGGKGAVFVQGHDPKNTLIHLTPGTGTRVQFGFPPAPPTPISAGRFQKLSRGLPFVTRPTLNEAAEGKLTTEEALDAPPAQEPEPEPEPAAEAPASQGGGAAKEMTVNGIQRVISTPVIMSPDKINSATSAENSGSNSQGVVGQSTSGSGDNAPATKNIQIRIDLK